MADFITKSQRSALMSSIKGKANKETELCLAALFRQYGIKGWRRHYRISGKPDFVFTKARLAIFVDGCFWHGCPWHYRRPTSNQKFWDTKFTMNRKRDRRVNRELRDNGWQVMRIWQHQLEKPEKIIKIVKHVLKVSSRTKNRRLEII